MCQGDHADRSKCPSWSDWALSARLASGQCRSRAAVADLTSGHALSYSTLRDRTGRRWHPGPAPVAIDRSGPRSRTSTSAVTVKVAKRSASGPDTAGASGPGLAPPPGAARSIRFARAAHRARVPPPRAAADHQGLVERAGPDRAGQPYQQHVPTTSRSTHTTCIPPAGPLPGSGVGRSWSDLVDDRWQDLLGRLEAAANEIEEIELPLERRPTP